MQAKLGKSHRARMISSYVICSEPLISLTPPNSGLALDREHDAPCQILDGALIRLEQSASCRPGDGDDRLDAHHPGEEVLKKPSPGPKISPGRSVVYGTPLSRTACSADHLLTR